MQIRANNGAEYYLMDVLAQVIKYLKNELIVNTLQRAGYDLEATDFDWVIAVPASWWTRDSCKQMMRDAGIKVILAMYSLVTGSYSQYIYLYAKCELGRKTHQHK